MSDPFFSNVVSLLHFDGMNGSSTFSDQTGKTWSATGATIQALGQKFGTACGNFDAIGRYIDATSSDFTLGTGDFTIEGFIYSGASGGKVYADMRPASTNGLYPTIYSIDNTIYYYTNNANRITGASVLSASIWQHVALCRASGVTRLFVDGTQAGASYSDSNDYIGTRLRLGNGGDNPVSGGLYLDEWRITKGVARYSTAFTPPTAAFPDVGDPPANDSFFGNVSALLHFDGADASTSLVDVIGDSWAVAGNAQLDTAQAKFGASSLLLDGSGDYITGPGSTTLAFGTGDFTIELWVRPAALTAPHILFDFRPSGVNNGDYPYCYVDAANIVYNTNATDRIVAAHGISTGAWVHIALSRASGVARVFVGGVQKGSGYTNAQSMLVGANRPTFGATGGNTPGQFGFNGHFDDIRITKGVARYTANFTPPTAPFPDKGLPTTRAYSYIS